MPKTPRQQNPALKNITGHLGHDGTQALLRGLDHYLDSGGSLNQLRALIYGEWIGTKDGGHVRRTGTGCEYYPPDEDTEDPMRPHPTYPNCATCDGGGCGDCS